jgi:hypothetical protein
VSVVYGAPVYGVVGKHSPSEILEEQGRGIVVNYRGFLEDLDAWAKSVIEAVAEEIQEGESAFARFMKRDDSTKAVVMFGHDVRGLTGAFRHPAMADFAFLGISLMNHLDFISQVTDPRIRTMYDEPAMVYPYPTEEPEP